MFADPSEAVFAIVKNFIDMEPHHDLRDELLRRILDGSIKRGLEDAEAGRVRDADEVFDELRRKMAAPRPAPARWEKIARCTSSSAERRVGKEGVSRSGCRWSPYH